LCKEIRPAHEICNIDSLRCDLLLLILSISLKANHQYISRNPCLVRKRHGDRYTFRDICEIRHPHGIATTSFRNQNHGNGSVEALEYRSSIYRHGVKKGSTEVEHMAFQQQVFDTPWFCPSLALEMLPVLLRTVLAEQMEADDLDKMVQELCDTDDHRAFPGDGSYSYESQFLKERTRTM
jgi:hypothetical protein